MERLAELAGDALDWFLRNVVELACLVVPLVTLACLVFVYTQSAIEPEAGPAAHPAANQEHVAAGQDTIWRWSTRLRLEDQEQAVGYLVEFTTAITAERKPMCESTAEQSAQQRRENMAEHDDLCFLSWFLPMMHNNAVMQYRASQLPPAGGVTRVAGRGR